MRHIACAGGGELCRGGRGHVRARVEYNWRTGTRHITTTTHHHHVRIFHIKPHPTGDSLAAPAMSESCCYCQAPLHQGVANVAALACGHVFHETCLQQHQRHSGIRNLGDLRCPECRMDAHACSQREAAIMRGDTPARAEPDRKRARAMQWPSSQDPDRVHTRPNPTMLTSHAASSSSRQTRAATPQRLAQVQASTPERRAPVPPLSGSPSIQPRALVLAAATPRRRRPHTDQASQESPLATPGGHSPPRMRDDYFHFSFADQSRVEHRGGVIDDKSDQMLQRLRSVGNEEELRTLLHPSTMFRELADADTCRETAVRWLRGILADERSHRAIGMDESFSIQMLIPEPVRVACLVISASGGWQAEALMQGVVSNVAWLEHHQTELKETEREHHSRKATIAMFSGGMQSAGKSSLCQYVTHTLLAVPNAPAPGCVCGDGTMKGYLTAITEHNRGGLVNDEITTAYETSHAQHVKGAHLVGKPKMLTFVNGETSVTITGHGHVALETYAFLHQVWGQFEPLEEVLARDGIGFKKRFNVTWFARHTRTTGQLSGASRDFLKGMMAWLCENALPFPAVHFFDKFALTMYRAFLEGIEQFLDENEDLEQLIREKLQFADTDIMRLANAQMRMCQYARSKTPLPPEEGTPGRVQISVYELAHALHAWKRQIHLHIAHTKWDAVNGPRPALATLRALPATPVSLDDMTCKRILVGIRFKSGAILGTNNARMWVRHKL